MFDHVTIRVADVAASHRFYAVFFAPLGIEPNHEAGDFVEWEDFSIKQPENADAVTTGLHAGFVAGSTAAVDAAWRAAVDAGYSSDGEPGPRPVYGGDYYGAFLLDPDGNSIEAVHHGSLRRGGNIDHLWIRVADVAASAAFYDLIGPYAGFARTRETEQLVQFKGESGSFSVLHDERPAARNIHLAFPAPYDGAVAAFHAAAVGAGYRDNGPPGERPEWHPGYEGAFVLDPDGHNVEVVDHHR
jgi:catechol 2,3-dioxygenase-like lactoylglutathione lyase family enzyme